MTAQTALAICVKSDLTRDGYNVIRNAGNDYAKAKVFPSSKCVAAAKAECYPDNIQVTEVSAEVPLQSLLQHTIQRLVMGITYSQPPAPITTAVFHCK